MSKFEIRTTFQFPFLRINELVKCTDIKKPSGICYILLVLIKDSKDKKSNLSITLQNFGIPKTLHFIFEDALYKLIQDEIIKLNMNEKTFEEYIIDDFSFTEKGVKVFKEESISTGRIKEYKIPLFYDIANNNLSLGLLKSNMDPKPLMDSAIKPEFMEQFTVKKDIEDFLNSNKGKNIPIYDENSIKQKDILIKKEEIITEVKTEDTTSWVAKFDCTLKISDDEINFIFDNKNLMTFFETYYNSKIINKFIILKEKFKLNSSFENELKISSFSRFEIEKVLIPKDLSNELNKNNKLLITKGNYLSGDMFTIKETTGLENNISKSCEFVLVDQNNTAFAYILGIFEFNNAKLKKIKIPLILKLKLSIEQLQNVLLPYLETKKDYSENSFKEIIKLTNITNDTTRACNILKGYMKDIPENNIVILNEIKDYVNSNKIVFIEYKNLLIDNYYKYIKNIDENKLETFLKITHFIPNVIGINESVVLKQIFENISTINSPLTVYEKLIKSGFERNNVLIYVNPIPEILDGSTSTDKAILDFINYQKCYEEIKSITGINNFINYTINIEKIDKNEFKQRFNTIYSLTKQIEVFRNSNIEFYKNLDYFMIIFSRINDDFNMLDKANKNPNNISLQLIEKKIIDGDYQYVFVNLAAKLESILKNKFKLEGPLFEKLSTARKEKIIDESIIKDLFDFKENRNAYIHPDDRKAKFQPDDIRRWSKEIFQLDKEEENK